MMYFTAFIILLLAQIADVFYTKLFLINGGRELNPLTDLVIVELGWAALLLMKSLPALIGVWNAHRWQEAAERRGGFVLFFTNSMVIGITLFYVLMIVVYTWIVANGLHL